jgi:hypothetical protein
LISEKAIAYWLKAGRLSIARGAMTGALVQLRKGLELASGLPDGAPRQEQELNLQITLGNALLVTNGYAAPEPGEAYARARLLCERLNRPPKLGVLVGQVTFHLVRGELEQAEHHAQEIHRLAETQNYTIWKRAAPHSVARFTSRLASSRTLEPTTRRLSRYGTRPIEPPRHLLKIHACRV